MLPAARVQAAIELLDLIITAARENGAAADTIIARWFRERRYAGSKDRAAVRDHVFRAIRSFGAPPASGRAAIRGLADLDDLFDGTPHGPAPIKAGEAVAKTSLIPAWLAPHIPDEQRAALLDRAPFDLRVNALKASRETVLPMFAGAVPIEGTAFGVRLPENIALGTVPEAEGLVEVQDAGSQLIAAACLALPGQKIIDLCAGAGGKTLALAATMAGQGHLIACDTDRSRLSRLPARANLAGVPNVETRVLNPMREADTLADLYGTADCVLIDAPCSGSGTWRRNPELRWRLTPRRLEQTRALQAHVLDVAAPLVRVGGRLVYAVCSVLDVEGRAQIEAFLEMHPDFAVADTGIGRGRPSGHGIQLTPFHDATDGFFIAALTRTC